MYNIEQLKLEKDSCRRKVITLSILTGVAMFLILLAVLIYIFGLVAILESSMGDEEIAAATLGAVVIFVIVVVHLCLAICVFVPFIVINGIKLGKRRRLLNKIENDNGVING